jgi:hypothetical protein
MRDRNSTPILTPEQFSDLAPEMQTGLLSVMLDEALRFLEGSRDAQINLIEESGEYKSTTQLFNFLMIWFGSDADRVVSEWKAAQ